MVVDTSGQSDPPWVKNVELGSCRLMMVLRRVKPVRVMGPVI